MLEHEEAPLRPERFVLSAAELHELAEPSRPDSQAKAMRWSSLPASMPSTALFLPRKRRCWLRLACRRRAGLRGERAPECVEVGMDRPAGDLQFAHCSLDVPRRSIVCFCACHVAPCALDVIRLRRTMG